MLLHHERWKSTWRLGFGLLCALALVFLSVAPATAQLDPGTRWAQVVGHWTRGARDTVAWVDLDRWRLVTGVDGVIVSDPDPSPWMPVAGDWDGSGVDTVKMFNAKSWKLVSLLEGPITIAGDPQPQPWVPVAGNWDGRRVDAVRVVDLRDRSVHKLEEGPLPVTGYDDPSPNPWRPVIGDWLRGGYDSIAWAQVAGAAGAWSTVAGDWKASGVTTLAAQHKATGALVSGAALKARALVVKGCSVTIKNRAEVTLETTGADGRVSTSGFGVHEEWTCCPSSTGAGLNNCSEALIAE